MTFEEIVDVTGKVVDGVGVIVIVVGAAVASVGGLLRWRRAGEFASVYGRYRQDLGRAVLLGLELLVAGDIIRTVAIAPTFGGLGTLAVLVVIRTFLSVALIVELEGRLPWQHSSPAPRDGGDPNASAGQATPT